MEQIKSHLGEDTSDEALTLLEDITDTINDLDTKAKGDGTDWKLKYEENDKQWRDKYRDRFFNGNKDNHDNNDNDDEQNGGSNESPKTFEELFSTNK